MSGSNDSNPIKFLTEISVAIKLLHKCNVYIVGVLHNAFLNVKKMNYNLRLLVKIFPNCSFVEANRDTAVVD